MQGEVHVLAILTIKPENAKDAEPLIRQLVEQTRKEQGNLKYQLLEVAGKPGEFVIEQTFKNIQALEFHKQTEHFINIPKQLSAWFNSPPQIRVLTKKM